MALQSWRCVLRSPEARAAGHWGPAEELLSTLGVKETFQTWMWLFCPSNPNTPGLEETPRVGRTPGPPGHCCAQDWSSLRAGERWSGSEWIPRLVDCGCELSCKREGFGIQLA